MSATTKPPEHRSLVRPKGVALLALLAGTAGVYLTVLFDSHLKEWIETVATKQNGAQVSVRELSTSWWRGRVELRDIQIASPARPMRNFVHIDSVSLDFLPWPLLANKIVITELAVDGVRINTPRDQSGQLPVEEGGEPYVSLFERAVPLLSPILHARYGGNPLGQLAQFSVGLDVQNKFDAHRDRLKSLRAIESIRAELETQRTRWQSAAAELPDEAWFADRRHRLRQLNSERTVADNSREALRTELTEAKRRVSGIIADFRQASDSLEEKLRGLDSLVAEDTRTLRDTLGLPNLDAPDLTDLLFGPRVTNVLERMMYWVDLSRRRMPKGSRQGQLILNAAGSSTNVHFGKMSAHPAVIVRHGVIRSDAGTDPYRGTVRGTLEGLTSDPPIHGYPGKIHIEADFRGQGISGVRIDAEIDHAGREVPRYHETLDVKFDTYPISKWALHNSSDLGVIVERATASGRFRGEALEERAKADWQLALNNVEYKVNTPYRQVGDALRGIFNHLPELQVAGSLSGTAGNSELKLSSNVGKQLAGALRAEFRHPMAAIDDSLRKFILDELDAPRAFLDVKISDFRQQWEPIASAANRDFDALLDLADPGKPTLGARDRNRKTK